MLWVALASTWGASPPRQVQANPVRCPLPRCSPHRPAQLIVCVACAQALLNASHKYHDAVHSFKNYGIVVDNVRVDWGAMQKQKDTAVSGLTKGIEGLFKKNKVCSRACRAAACYMMQAGVRVSVTHPWL